MRTGRVRELRGIGPGIEARLRELVETGDIAELAELERELAPDLVGLGRYLGLGAKRSVEIARALGVRTAEELREAAAAGRLRTVPGIGPKTEARLLEALAREAEPRPQRGLLLNRAWELVGGIAAALGGEAAGDVRRWRDSCELLAVVCAAPDPRPMLARFAALPQIVAVVEQDERRAVGVTVEGVAGRARRRRAGAASGPRSCARPARRRTSRRSSRCRTRPTRPTLYRALGIPWCPARAARGAVPRRAAGAASSATTSAATCTATRPGRTAGRASRRWAAPPASAATSTSRSATTRRPSAPSADSPPTMSAARPRRSRRRTSVLAPFRVLRGIECDILPDGRLDLPDDVLAELDWVQASVHGGQRMPRAEMTKRVEEALRNPYVRCLSHPTGRLINRRPENALDLERAFEVALEEGVAVEVNGLPDRLDLRGEHVRDALRAGVRVVCSTDAHSVRGLANMTLSVQTARRGWATAADVVNTQPLRSLLDGRRAVR